MTEINDDFLLTRTAVLESDALFADAYDKPLVAYLARRGAQFGISKDDAREIVQSWWRRHFDRRVRGVATVRETFDRDDGRFRHYVSHDLWFHACEWRVKRDLLSKRYSSLEGLMEGSEDERIPADDFPEIDELRDHALELLNGMREAVASVLPSDQHRRFFELKWPATGRKCPTDVRVAREMNLSKPQVAALKKKTLDALRRVLDLRLRGGRPFLEGAESELLERNLERFGKALEVHDPGDDDEDGSSRV